MEEAALVISILAFCLALFQFLFESHRKMKEATLEAFLCLQSEVFPCLREYDIEKIEEGGEEWEKITTCMARIENFSVGVNTRIYSWRTLNRVGGGFFISQYARLKPIIRIKRKDKKMGHYDEFEKVVRKLKRNRKRSR